MTDILESTVHNKASARLDARGVAKLFDVTLVDIANAIGKSEDTVRKNSDSAPIQENLGILVDCFARVYDLMQHDERAVRRWMHRPNRGLDGERPIGAAPKRAARRTTGDGSADGDGELLLNVFDERLSEAALQSAPLTPRRTSARLKAVGAFNAGGRSTAFPRQKNTIVYSV